MANNYSIISRENMHPVFDSSRQNNIDLLRAIAVISVFISHSQHVYGGDFPFFGNYGGQFGPQLFFVISGYLISGSFQKYSLQDYIFHRIFRIFPEYLFFFLGIGLITGTISLNQILQSPWKFTANLILLHQLFPPALIAFDVLHVTWTLTVEILWYILAPLLLFGNRVIRWPTVLVAILISTSWAFLASTQKIDNLYPGITDINPGHSYLFIGNHFFLRFVFLLLVHGSTFRKTALLIGTLYQLSFSGFLFL